jgi:O-antigen/teichoic acid export membrane protein
MTRSLFYSTISAGSALFMLLLLLVAGRSLGTADYGVFTFAIGLATLAEVFMDFGLHQITVRAIARDASEAGHVLQTSLWLKALPGLATIAVFGLAACVLRSDPTVRLVCLVMLASAAMRSYLMTAKGVLLGLEAFGNDAIITAADRALLFAGCGWALWAGASVVQLSLVFLLVRIVSAIGAVWVARRHVGPGQVDRALGRRLSVEALPIGLSMLVVNMYMRIDGVMLGTMMGDTATGLYGAACNLYEGLTYAAAVISSVLAPRLSRLWAEAPSDYRALAFRGLAGSFALALVIAVFAWPLADLGMAVFGPEFAPATTSLRLLLVGLPFVYLTWVLHAAAIAAHRTRALLVVTSVGTVLNVGLNLFLIPRYSYNGASVATVITEIFAVAALAYGLRSAFQKPSSTAV